MERFRIMSRVKLTAGRIRDFACPNGKAQKFFWDTEAPGLAVRVTVNGAKAYIFQGKLANQTIRITIGDVKTWAIEAGETDRPGAREAARSLQALIDQKIDPRHAKAEEIAAANAKREQEAAARQAQEEANRRNAITMGEVWSLYINARRSKWSQRHLADHQKVIQQKRTNENGRALTAGVLASLAPLALSELTPERVAAWLEEETPKRGTQAALAFRLLRAFINWCANHKEYQGIASSDACARKVSREHLPKAKAKDDCLQREQLRTWFDSVIRIPNRTISAYLQILLLVGCRREELGTLRWENIDFQWNSLTIRDKVEGARTIPMTPYVRGLLLELKARNETKPAPTRILRGKRVDNDLQTWQPSPWVFSSKTSANGRMMEPSIAHRKALAAAGLPPVSLHGLRRSFGSLSEWVEVPVGIVAQIQGHKPSATAEKHYRVRPLDLLRMWHTKIESWILEQAGIEQPAQTASNLQMVGSNTAA